MIKIPDQLDMDDLQQQINALQDHLKVYLVPTRKNIGVGYKIVPKNTFEGAPPEDLVRDQKIRREQFKR